MSKYLFVCIALLCISGLWAQEISTPYKNKKIIATRDTIRLDSVSINPSFFKLLDRQKKEIDTSLYKINFQKATLVFNEKATFLEDTLSVRFLKFPDFLTKTYSIYDDSRIVSNKASGKMYRMDSKSGNSYTPFEGLNTSGSITRGITVGNNQNSAINSALDIQITGKISEDVSIRASIQDNNIPLQNGGYSQKLDEFDQVFIELFSNKWNLRGGDLFLENRSNSFLNFSKKVQGISASYRFGNEDSYTNVFGSGALVRGQYARSTFIGQEGNQGPYKLKGPNGELYVLIISGSERVYVNGILLKRGENNQYTIDYNAGEIIFTPLFPITSEMRINVEYQYSDKNYTRFVTYTGVNHEQKTWSLGGNLYSENDVKNQPLQQSLSADQAQILANAGDNPNLMAAPSAYVDTYAENKILYRKTSINGVEIYEFSQDPNETLYSVKFSLVGLNKGNYILKNTTAVEKIYEYTAPIAGIPQGSYEPIVQLIPPIKLQVANIFGKYNPSEQTQIGYEIGLSNNDQNLFSSKDDQNNTGAAGKFNAKHQFRAKKWNADVFANYQFVQQNFKTVERLYTIEFNRDWNLTNPTGNQNLLICGSTFNLSQIGLVNYQFETLAFSNSFSGNRHVLTSNLNWKNWNFYQNGSYLESDNTLATSQFLRNRTQVKYHFAKNWAGATTRSENNQEKTKSTNLLSAISQKYREYGFLFGRGDSTKVFVETGYLNRVNDSIQSGFLKRVNQSHSYYIKSRLMQSNTGDLSVFINYRNLKFEDLTRKDEPSLNSRLIYNDRFFNQLIQWNTTYENNSGTIAQQEFTYVKVDPGKGMYTWNDYNNNGIQELEEFEVAKFIDQANYIRVFLPNQVYVKTHKNKFSQSLVWNPIQWQNQKGLLKTFSYFYNQTSLLSERKISQNGDHFDLNPFGLNSDLLGLNTSFRNNLYFNRGKQRHSITYSYLVSHLKNLLTSGSQENKIGSHQVQYLHLYQKSWLFDITGKLGNTTSLSENYGSKNYELKNLGIASKISYLFSVNTRWDLLCDWITKTNQTGDEENLEQMKLGTSFSYSESSQLTMNGEFSFFNNNFIGNSLSPVAYQMLEGLQKGKNLTWRLLIQRKINRFLDLNFNYEGRKSETLKAIHTGSLQLRAYF